MSNNSRVSSTSHQNDDLVDEDDDSKFNSIQEDKQNEDVDKSVVFDEKISDLDYLKSRMIDDNISDNQSEAKDVDKEEKEQNQDQEEEKEFEK